VLQCVSVFITALRSSTCIDGVLGVSVLQCVAEWYSVLQCVVGCCSVLQCVAPMPAMVATIAGTKLGVGVLQCVLGCCRVVQCVAA